MGNHYFKPCSRSVDNLLLKHAIANQVNDVTVYQSCDVINTQDLAWIERVMNIVRDNGPFEHWQNLVFTGSNLNKDGFEKTLREIISQLSIVDINSSLVYVLYTYVVDVVVFKLKNQHSVNVDDLLNVTHALIFEKTVFCC